MSEKIACTAIQITPADFTLVSPAAEAALHDYRFTDTDIHRFSCPPCAVYLFDYGMYEMQGRAESFFSVNLHAIDKPQPGIDLTTFKIRYWNGLRDNWDGEPAEAPFSGGIV